MHGVKSERSMAAEAQEEEETHQEEKEPQRSKGIPLYWYGWFIVGIIDVLGPVASDAYTPNTPKMRRSLDTTNVLTGLTLQLNWLSKGLATLWIGALSDQAHCGRLGAINRTFVVFTIGAVGSFLTPTKPYGIYTFIACRVVEGLGESATTVCSAIARDAVDDPEERMKLLTFISTLRLAAIGIAPTFGGLIGDAYGWRALFLVLAVVAILLALTMRCLLPETLHSARVLQARRKKEKERAAAAKSLWSSTQRDSDNTEPLLLADDTEDDEEAAAAAAPGRHDDERREGPSQDGDDGDDQKPKGEQRSFGPVLRRLCFDRSPEVGRARASITMVIFGLSGFYCFLAQISPLLEDEFGVSVVNTALFMGSGVTLEVGVNFAMGWCMTRFKGASWIEPEALLKCCLRLSLLSAVANMVCAFGPDFLRESWLYLLLNLYLFSVAVSFGFGPASTLFIQPFPEDAGKAAAIQLIARTAAGTGLSQISSDVTSAFGLKGYYASFALVVLGTQIAWLFLPGADADRGSTKAAARHQEQDLPEELRENLLGPDDDDLSTVESSAVDSSSVAESSEAGGRHEISAV